MSEATPWCTALWMAGCSRWQRRWPRSLSNHPNIIDNSGESVARTAEVGRSKRGQHELQDAPHSLRVFSPDGRLVWKAPNAVAQQPASDHVLDQVRFGKPVFETTETTDGTPVRHVFISIPRQGQVRYVLQAETSLVLYRARATVL